MNYYCTLFNTYYLSRGVALYESLCKVSEDFHLYILAFDDQTYEILTSLSFERVTVIRLEDFEDEELLAVKPGRTLAEYCWTCSPSIIKYCIETYDLPGCTYLDADIYFFQDPAVLMQELGDQKSIIITEHRFPKHEEHHMEAAGRYCVQWVTFKRDENGMEALNWWRDRCIEWCFYRLEDGKMGDQKYLDDWTERFQGVQVLEHLGGGMAPWNVISYKYDLQAGELNCEHKETGERFQPVFYHYQQFKFFQYGLVDLGNYTLEKEVREFFYLPYLRHLHTIRNRIRQKWPTVEPHPRTKFGFGLRKTYNFLDRIVSGKMNLFSEKGLLALAKNRGDSD